MVWRPKHNGNGFRGDGSGRQTYAHFERPLKFSITLHHFNGGEGFFISYRRSENTRFQNNPTQLSLVAHLSGSQFAPKWLEELKLPSAVNSADKDFTYLTNDGHRIQVICQSDVKA
jgi:hypothetical protein